MVEYSTILALSFLRLSRFTGSERGMRYVIEPVKGITGEGEEKQEGSLLQVSACPGPFSVDKTRRELFQTERFPFSEEGKRLAVDWLNRYYNDNRDLLEDVYYHPMAYRDHRTEG